MKRIELTLSSEKLILDKRLKQEIGKLNNVKEIQIEGGEYKIFDKQVSAEFTALELVTVTCIFNVIVLYSVYYYVCIDVFSYISYCI